MKCFIIKRADEYVYMFVEEALLEEFYEQHGHQVLVEADDLESALRKLSQLPR